MRLERLIASIIVLTVLFSVGQVAAQSRELSAPSPHKIPSPQAQTAFDLAKLGHIEAAVEAMRGPAQNSAENSHYLGILLYAWRQQLARERIDPIPPVDWEMDWQRCSALIDVRGEGGGLQASILAEYYEYDILGGREKSGQKTPRVPGPGRSAELAQCWSGVSEGTAAPQDCLDREQPLRIKRKLPAFACPPQEPTRASLAKYPAVKIAD